MTEVRAGKKVAVAFYGHHGVFFWSSHKATQTAKKKVM